MIASFWDASPPTSCHVTVGILGAPSASEKVDRAAAIARVKSLGSR